MHCRQAAAAVQETGCIIGNHPAAPAATGLNFSPMSDARITNAVEILRMCAPADESVMTLQIHLVKEGGKWKIDRVKEVFAEAGKGRMT